MHPIPEINAGNSLSALIFMRSELKKEKEIVS